MDVLATTRIQPSAALPTATATMWRYPEASALLDGPDWWVDLGGPAEAVRPAGMVADPDWQNEPRLMRHTLHQMVEDLREHMTVADEEAAARLARHAVIFAAPDFCIHGLPMWHVAGCTYSGPPSSPNPGFRVHDVRRLVNFLDGLRDATDLLSRQRRGLPSRIVEDIVGYPIVEDWYAELVRAELLRDGALAVPRSRQMVALAFDRAMSASGLRLGARWPKHRRPQLMLIAESTIAAYVADTLAHVGGDSVDRSYVCSSCGLPFTPKRSLRDGEGRFCSRTECQRARDRAKHARAKERLN